MLLAVCAQLRIPVFIVGKPGSSKSLGKAIVQDVMTGSSSPVPLFQRDEDFGRTAFQTNQCSPHSTAKSILDIFQKASMVQQQLVQKAVTEVAAEGAQAEGSRQQEQPSSGLDENCDASCAASVTPASQKEAGHALELERITQAELRKEIAVVVLDEVGLAEESQHLPLKALHPLLETGISPDGHFGQRITDKVAFMGLSNWNLDPAKMNRAILVMREELNRAEMIRTARAIFRHEGSLLFGAAAQRDAGEQSPGTSSERDRLIESIVDGYRAVVGAVDEEEDNETESGMEEDGENGAESVDGAAGVGGTQREGRDAATSYGL
ncbi:unnamed protein product, partial [Amoebophrya sp. A120]|eukprot:GSA120T00025520001.1